jgi:hypothetical protein
MDSGRLPVSAPSEDPMTELQQPSDSGQRTARGRTPRPRRGGIWGSRTIPALPPPDPGPPSEPTILGFPAELADEDDDAEPLEATSPPVEAGPPVEDTGPGETAEKLVVLKRSDRFGGSALVLAGVAANVSLMLSWVSGEGPTGLSLVERGGEVLGAGLSESARSDAWPPVVVVLCGGLLVVLGLLLLVPARTHRLVGVLALLVASAAAAAVVLLLADNGWGVDRFGPGMWCAVAVPVLGVLGALKAMLTAPRVTLGTR